MTNKQYAELFKALSDETRLEILHILRNSGACPAKQIGMHFKLKQPTLSYHLNLLCEVGLITATERWKWVDYSLNRDMKKVIGKAYDEITKGTFFVDDED